MKSTLIITGLLVTMALVASVPSASAAPVCVTGDTACVCWALSGYTCTDSTTGRECYASAGATRSNMVGVNCR